MKSLMFFLSAAVILMGASDVRAGGTDGDQNKREQELTNRLGLQLTRRDISGSVDMGRVMSDGHSLNFQCGDSEICEKVNVILKKVDMNLEVTRGYREPGANYVNPFTVTYKVVGGDKLQKGLARQGAIVAAKSLLKAAKVEGILFDDALTDEEIDFIVKQAFRALSHLEGEIADPWPSN